MYRITSYNVCYTKLLRQIFYSLPFYIRDVLKFDRFEILETVDAWTIILVTVAATALARNNFV